MDRFRLTAILFLPFLLAGAQPRPGERPRVFPGARGFGVRTLAGHGGRIVRVTNLNAEGSGSLRDAVTGKGARVVVFEVGGVVDLQGRDLEISEPFLTLAGQSAPSPGITVIRGSILIRTHDILFQHLRVRPGSFLPVSRRGEWAPGIAAIGPEAYNVVIDHCSVSWAPDENLAVTGPRFNGPQATARNITFSNSIVAESLESGKRGPGSRSSGIVVDDNCTNIAVAGNLLAHNRVRNPGFKANTTGAVINNVIYNPGRTAIQLDWPAPDWNGHPEPHGPKVSVVGNVLLYGNETDDGLPLIARKGDAYVSDNVAYDLSGTPGPITAGLINLLSERPAWPRGLVPLPAAKTLESVLRRAGARPRDRDSIDRRIVTEVRERKGKIIASQDEVGGYPKPAMTRRRLIVPVEDLDEWLTKMAVDVE